jgi:hypothetical protein
VGLPEQALLLYPPLRAALDRQLPAQTFHADCLEELHAFALYLCGRFDEAERIHWREYTQAIENHQIGVDAQRGLALGMLWHDRGNIEAAIKCFSFTSSYQVGWHPWNVAATIYAALAASCLPPNQRPHAPVPEGITTLRAGSCAMPLAMVKARTHPREW